MGSISGLYSHRSSYLDKLNTDVSDEFEDSAKTAIRLVWDLLESNGEVMKLMLTQGLLKTLVECLYLLKHSVISEDVSI